MPRNGIVGEGGVGRVRFDDLSEGNKTELNQCLKSVADSAHQPVPPLEQVRNLFPDFGVAEERGDEFAASVRFVTAGKAAGKKDDLRLLQFCRKLRNACRDIVGTEIPDHCDLGNRARVGNGFGGIVFAVCTRKDRNQHARLRRSDCGRATPGCMVGEGFRLRCAIPDVAGEYAFQFVLINGEQCRERDGFSAMRNLRGFRCRSEQGVVLCSVRHFQEEGSVAVAEYFVCSDPVRISESDAVAEAHFHNRRGNAAHSGRIAGNGFSAVQQIADRSEHRKERFRHGQAVFVICGTEQNHVVSSRLEFGGDDVADFGGRNGEGNERWRNVQLLKASAHRILSADRADAEFHLRLECAEERGGRLAPTRAVLPGMLEIFLEGQVHLFEISTRRNEFADRFHHGKISALIGVLFGEERIVTERHERAVVGVLFLH